MTRHTYRALHWTDLRPHRCPECGRYLWSRADVAGCKGGILAPHRWAEMEVIRPEDSPAESSPDIVTG